MSKHKWANEIMHALEHGLDSLEYQKVSPYAETEWQQLSSAANLGIFGEIDCRFRIRDPYRELKEARAAGKTIQKKRGTDTWEDETKDYPWTFTEMPTCYRIKPLVLEYRIALMTNRGLPFVGACAREDYPSNDDACLIRWLSDWQEVEV